MNIYRRFDNFTTNILSDIFLKPIQLANVKMILPVQSSHHQLKEVRCLIPYMS